jgi:hypothetical protein
MLEISQVAELLAASQEGLSSVELVNLMLRGILQVDSHPSVQDISSCLI